MSVDHFQYHRIWWYFCVDMKYSNEELYSQTLSDGKYVPNIILCSDYLEINLLWFRNFLYPAKLSYDASVQVLNASS